jgi:hypothetical protein
MRDKPESIINLTPVYDANSFSEPFRLVSGLIIFNASKKLAASHLVQRFFVDQTKIVLVNFQPTSDSPDYVEFVYTGEQNQPFEASSSQESDPLSPPPHEHKRIPLRPELFSNRVIRVRVPSVGPAPTASAPPIGQEQISPNLLPVEINISYFPDWMDKNGSRLFQTDTNHMVIFPFSEMLEIRFSQPLNMITTVVLYLLILILIAVPAISSGIETLRRRRIKRSV